MPRINLKFCIDEQVISRADSKVLRAGDQSYIYAVFNSSQEWDELLPKAIFKRDERVWIMPLNPGRNGLECRIPWEVMDEAGLFYVGLYGGQTLLTNLIHVEVGSSCMCGDMDNFAPTKDVFDLLNDRLKRVEREIRELVEQGGGEISLKDIPIASTETAGLVKVGENLEITEDGTLNVLTADNAQEDNTRPITAAAVYAQVGNIDALLETL